MTMTIQPTSEQKEALQTLFDTGVDRANTMLNYLTEWPVYVQMAPIELLTPRQLHKKMEEPVGSVKVAAMELIYRGEFEGIALLVFPAKTAATLVETLADEQRRTLDQDSVKMKTLSEVGNIFLNGLMGSLSNIIKGGITYMAPSYKEGPLKDLIYANEINPNSTVLFGKAEFHIEQLQSKASLILFFMVDPLEILLTEVERINH
ncbi:hypothetical protein NG798_21960 [Ancylothrix sp. C2]|uniref:hypothetical protein n=1 Tax=Ancylothrix sp. D3o TaxID=2953691 RepID=UPI0021BB6A58|nr:hypothetical protein [Ancylothrix sp. D3o]MCT7952463.1 hypothetical protein [Ancylothrix sp. D3o]